MRIWRNARTSTLALMEALLPRSLFWPGLPLSSPVVIKVSTLPLDARDRLAVQQARRPVSIVLDPDLALRRRIELPKAVGNRAEAAIGLQLRQTLPGQGQNLTWQIASLGRAGEKVAYAVYILKRGQVEDLLKELRSLGAQVHSIAIAAPSLQPFWHYRPRALQTAKNWQGFSALTVAAVSLIAVMLIEMDRANLEALVRARTDQIESLENRLLAKQSQIDEGKAEAAALLAAWDEFSGQSRRLQQLADLTASLPDSVWISELSISGDRLVLSGFTSGEVAEVLSQIQKEPWARDVKLNGAVSFDSYSGQNRFELGMSLGTGGPA